MGTVWIDLTDMMGWTGEFGGTQRVVYGIAYEYYLESQRDAAKVKYFYYDAIRDVFYEADFAELVRRKEAQDKAKHVKTISPVSRKALLKKAIKRVIPAFVRHNTALMTRVERAARTVLHNVRRGVRRLRYGKQNQDMHIKVNFRTEDTLLLLGKPWDTPEMMPAIQSVKEETGVSVVTLIYDLVISLYPHLHTPLLFTQYTQFLFYAATVSDLVLPISRSTEADFLEFCDRLKIKPPKSSVIRIGDIVKKHTDATPPREFERYAKEPYLLCVGTIEVRKNHALLYNAYKLANERKINLPRLVIVGRLGWSADDIYTVMKNDPLMKGKITILEKVTDSELTWLYNHCTFSVYPSMYEGWGLPVAESLQHNKIVVASNASSVPEIAGELIEYFSPYSADELLHLLVKYLDDVRRTKAEKRINSEYKSTTWKKTYAQVKASLGVLAS